MTKLPTRDDLGPMPNADPNRPIARVDLTAKARGAINLGQGISSLGKAFTGVGSASNSVPDDVKFNTERSFQEFKYNEQKGLDDAIKNIDPDSSLSFADDWASSYQDRAKQFFSTVPEALKPKYDHKLLSTERSFYGHAAVNARTEQRRLYSNYIDSMRDNTYYKNAEEGKDVSGIINDYSDLVNENPYLSYSEKERKLLEGASEIEQAHILGRINRGENPDRIKLDLETISKPVKLFKLEVNEAITSAATKHNVDLGLMTTFARIESGGNPKAKTGSYKGLYQLSQSEFEKYGGKGKDIYDPIANADAAAAKIANESKQFQEKFGRAPTAFDLYMTHQQGNEGYAAHMANPEGVAWENIKPFYTDKEAQKRGFKDGEAYAKAAIWGNIPDDVKKKFPDKVNSVTSNDFMNIWKSKVERLGGDIKKSGKYQYLTQKQRDKLIAKIDAKKVELFEGEKEKLKNDLADNVEALKKSGKPIHNVDKYRINKMLGKDAFEAYQTKGIEAETEFKATHDLKGLTNEQLEKRLDDTEPNPSDPYYKIQSKVYEKVKTAVSQLRKQRRNDPAASVDELPDMASFVDAYRNNPDDNEAARRLVGARLKFQETVGIPYAAQSPITNDEANQYLDRVKGLDGKNLLDALNTMTGELNDRYGEYAPMVGKAILERKVKDSDIAKMLQYQLDRSFKGQPMSAYEKHKLDILNETAMAGQPFAIEEWALSGQVGGGSLPEGPPRFKEGEMDKVMALPPGTKFYDPNGILRTR